MVGGINLFEQDGALAVVFAAGLLPDCVNSGSIEAVGAVGLWAGAPGSAKSASKHPPNAIVNSERASMIPLSCNRNKVLMPSIHGDHDLLEACRILAPRP
jgi:hypothetical protein